jgi:hypothetical protein
MGLDKLKDFTLEQQRLALTSMLETVDANPNANESLKQNVANLQNKLNGHIDNTPQRLMDVEIDALDNTIRLTGGIDGLDDIINRAGAVDPATLDTVVTAAQHEPALDPDEATLGPVNQGQAQPDAQTEQASLEAYTIQAGDTLSALAAMMGDGTTYEDIQKMNSDTIADANRINAGQTIMLPEGSAEKIEAARESLAAAARPEPTPTPEPEVAEAATPEAVEINAPDVAAIVPMSVKEYLATQEPVGSEDRAGEKINREGREAYSDYIKENGTIPEHGAVAHSYKNSMYISAEVDGQIQTWEITPEIANHIDVPIEIQYEGGLSYDVDTDQARDMYRDAERRLGDHIDPERGGLVPVSEVARHSAEGSGYFHFSDGPDGKIQMSYVSQSAIGHNPEMFENVPVITEEGNQLKLRNEFAQHNGHDFAGPPTLEEAQPVMVGEPTNVLNNQFECSAYPSNVCLHPTTGAPVTEVRVTPDQQPTPEDQTPAPEQLQQASTATSPGFGEAPI